MARILAVEDEPGIALGLEDSLRLKGHEVEIGSVLDVVAAFTGNRAQADDMKLIAACVTARQRAYA